jgi:acyl-coenzyme A synthetase/AMP-(fatty) acid ligase/drug/metabolite transporter (DMT)-like permease
MIPLSKIKEVAVSRGDHPAIVWNGGALDWSALEQEVPKVVNGLLKTVDQADLSTICFLSQNRPELILMGAAAATLKVSFCGLDYSQSSEALEQMVEAAGADCLVVSSRLLRERDIDLHLVARRRPVIDLDSLLPGAVPFTNIQRDEPAPVPAAIERPMRSIGFTSGTSGRPKAVIRTASFDARRFAYFATRYGFSSADRHLVTIPLYHAAGSGWARLFMNLGATIVLAPPDDPVAAAELIRAEWITTSAMTPPILNEIVHQVASGAVRVRPNCLKFVLVGGKHFNASAKKEALKVFGPIVHEYYGTTETGVNTIADPDDLLTHPESVGRCYDGNSIAIVDRDTRPLTAGLIGRIAIASYMNMDAYEGAAAERVTIDGKRYFVTPETGYLDGESRLYLMNRSQGATSLNLYELESIISKRSEIRDVALVPSDASGKSKVDCAVALKAGATCTPEALSTWVADQLKGERIDLGRFRIIKAIPYSPSGKVKTDELRRAFDEPQKGPESPQKHSAALATAGRTHPALRGALLLLLTAISWGAMFPITKNALSSVDAFHITLVRYGAASLIFLAILARTEGWAALWPGRDALRLFFFGSLGFAGFSILAFLGLAHTKAQHGAIVMALMPLITAIMTWAIKGQRPNPVTFVCIALALFGVGLVITGGNLSTLSGGAIGPTLVILAGAFCWVAYTIGSGFVPGLSPVRYTALSAALGSISIAVATAGATVLGYIQTPSVQTLLGVKWELLYLILIAGVMAVFSWNAGIRALGPVNGVLFINLVPVTAFLIGFAQGRSFGGAELAGCAVTIAALVLNNLASRNLLPTGLFSGLTRRSGNVDRSSFARARG